MQLLCALLLLCTDSDNADALTRDGPAQRRNQGMVQEQQALDVVVEMLQVSDSPPFSSARTAQRCGGTASHHILTVRS